MTTSEAGRTHRAAGARHPFASVPLAARGPVSAALGRDTAAYRVAGLRAANPAQRLRMAFSPDGVTVASGAGRVRLALAGLGYASVVRRVAAVPPVATANRVSYAHPGVREWYANGPLGLEQGFDVLARPAAGSGPLTLLVGLGGDLRARLDRGGVLLSGRGARLRYGDLVVTDARGRVLRAWLRLAAGRLLIQVGDRGAVYPLRVDPFVQQAKLTASDAAAYDYFGVSVAVSSDGSTVVAGALGATMQGAVYVFTKPGSGWSSETQAAKLTASDAAAGAGLGYSVGVSSDGSTVVAGAYNATVGSNSGQGAVYVFTKPGSGWSSETQAAKLTASDGAANDHLGNKVAVSSDGSTVVAGVPAATVGSNSGQGAAYVFTKPGSGWSSETQAAKLTASDGAADNQLGVSVAVSSDGSTVVAGAWGANSVYVFTKPGSGWSSETQAAKLTASDGAGSLGVSVGVSSDGSTVVAGAFSAMVGSNSDQGAAYVFTKPGSGWSSETQAAKLTASDGAAGDEFGGSVGVSSDGSTVVAGAGVAAYSFGQGAVYVFTKPGSGWSSETQAAKLTASDGAGGAEFGSSVGVSADGSTVVAGAWGATVGSNYEQGAAYVFGQSSAASPSMSASGPPSGTAGSQIFASSISGTLSGGFSPSGAVVFKVFGPQSSPPTSCTSGGTTVGPASVSGNGTYHPSAGFAPTSAGDYWWYASYGGDSNNNPAASACGAGMAATVVSAAQHTLTVAKAGSGSGTVTSAPAGILCGSACQHSYNSGTQVTLTAAPSAGSTFAGWSGGGCSGTGTCVVTMSSDQAVTATFSLSSRSGSPTLGHTSVSGTTASVAVGCAGGGGASCTITLTLSAIETMKNGKVIAVTAAKKKSAKVKKRTVVLGRLTVTLAGGHSKTVKLALNRAGRQLLASRHTLRARLAISQSGKTVAGRTLTFKVKPKKRRRS